MRIGKGIRGGVDAGHAAGPCAMPSWATRVRQQEGRGKQATNSPRPEGPIEKEKQEWAGFGCWARKEREKL